MDPCGGGLKTSNQDIYKTSLLRQGIWSIQSLRTNFLLNLSFLRRINIISLSRKSGLGEIGWMNMNKGN
jgi:hypothetical protein